MWSKKSPSKAPPVDFLSLGLRPYGEVLAEQFRLREERREGRISDTVITVEHPKVITEGRRNATADFKVAPEELQKRGVTVEKVNRGGRLTYHGPGQLVAYFILDLRPRAWSVPQLVRRVEECGIQTFAQWDLPVERRSGCPGLWIEGRKIGSLGLSVDRGITMHGLALNVHPHLEDFSWIIPCGAADCEMTSLQLETGRTLSWEEFETSFRKAADRVLHSGLD